MNAFSTKTNSDLINKWNNPAFAGLFLILAERIGLEPMEDYSPSQISNLLHYHSANAPRALRLVLYINPILIASGKLIRILSLCNLDKY